MCLNKRTYLLTTAYDAMRIPYNVNLTTAWYLAEPLSMMFNSFFSIDQVPHVWSKAIITPVFKSGRSCDVANYRPIALTCVTCKLMERVVATRLLDYLRMHKLISKDQHGFLSRRSTVSNLLESVSDWTLALNNSQSVMYM